MVVIVGASKGLGRYLFEAFKNENIDVIGTFNSTIEGFDVDKNKYYKVDILDYEAVKKWVNSIKEHLNSIILINCAGVSKSCFAHKVEIQDWQYVVKVNLFGTFNVIREILPIMREQNFGRIINISSVVAKYPTPGVSAYAASKAAIWGLTKTLAIENASKGITINAINLGYTEIGMGINDLTNEFKHSIKSKIPMKRFAEPNEVYKTIKYLIETPYVTGTSIDVNGGII